MCCLSINHNYYFVHIEILQIMKWVDFMKANNDKHKVRIYSYSWFVFKIIFGSSIKVLVVPKSTSQVFFS